MDFKKYDEPPVKHMISMIYEDEIERLNVKIERLREALKDMDGYVSRADRYYLKPETLAALKEKE